MSTYPHHGPAFASDTDKRVVIDVQTTKYAATLMTIVCFTGVGVYVYGQRLRAAMDERGLLGVPPAKVEFKEPQSDTTGSSGHYTTTVARAETSHEK